LEINQELLRRIEITSNCHDSDYIPKCENAGNVIALSNGIMVQLMFNGLKVVAGGYYGDWMQQIIQNLYGHHEPQEEKVFFEIVKAIKQIKGSEAPLAIMELGSFWSYYSLWFSVEFPKSKALLIEPDVNYLNVGVKNFELNGLKGFFVNEVVSKEDKNEIDFVQESDGKKIKVKVFDFDNTLKLNNLNSVDILMCDIQGHESYFFHQINRALKGGKVQIAIISTHHKSISGSWTTHENLLKYLTEIGGHIIAEHSVSESFSGDGLIAVSFAHEYSYLKVETSRARNNQNIFTPYELELESIELNTEVKNSVEESTKKIIWTRIKSKAKSLIRKLYY